MSTWDVEAEYGGASLAEVVRRVRPTILIGTSGRPQAFTEDVVREMAAHVDRPIIMPMSNPTVLAEAFPADLLAWTDGRALVASGSPFPPVTYDGTTYEIAQVNNALVFPGLGLGVIVARATRITDGMLLAAAEAVAGTADTSGAGASLLPRVADLRATSAVVAAAVARAARRTASRPPRSTTRSTPSSTARCGAAATTRSPPSDSEASGRLGRHSATEREEI